MKKYIINTYGCQMNVHESEKIAGVLEKYGFTETKNVKEADVIVFNTCCIREGAEQKIFANIGALKKEKQTRKDLIVAVLGCMTQQKTSADNLKAKFPWIDIILGTFNAENFEEHFCKVLEKKIKVFEFLDKEQAISENDVFYRTSGKNAWVNISYGCNNFCTYCIVPYVRGRERSRNSENIINECANLIKEGYKIITLLGQNVNSYGNDKEDEINFPELCRRICSLEGDFKVKFMSSHPKDFSPELIEVIATNNKMSKSVHLPVQSGSNRILNLMNRRYTCEDYKAKIDSLKERVPSVVLTSDFIVGFPTETEEDFMDTYNLVNYVQYNSIFAFMYSKRKGTKATLMEGQVDEAIKHDRVNRLLALQRKITSKKTKECVGQVFDCLIQKDENKVLAVTDFGRNIIIEDKEYDYNKFYKVKVDRYFNKKLYGTVLD